MFHVFYVLTVLGSFILHSNCAFYGEYTSRSAIQSYNVQINTEQCAYKTDEKFLSVALDSSLIRFRWENFNFSSEKLHNLAKGLAPAYLRIGGTDEDFLSFQPDKSHMETSLGDHLTHPFTNFTMTVNDVNNIFTFAEKNGLSIIFGLNVLFRDSKTHFWNSTNAESLMKYLASKSFSCGWELGNEPVDIRGLINRTVSAKELAVDFKILRKLLNEHPEYGHMLVGPDVSSPWRPPIRNKFLKEFLTNQDGCVDGLTYHQYYFNNQATVEDFFDPKILDDLITEIQQIQTIVKDTGTTIGLWLGETSSAYGGGVPGVSNSYIAGFMWLDKLGIAARLAHDVVIRQTFYGESYSLINLKNLEPFPDYWSSYLYKLLVGSGVLAVHDGISLGRTVRVYAHCVSARSGYAPGSIVLIALNTQHSEVQLVLGNGFKNLLVQQFLLTPGEGHNLTSQTVKLNGKLLRMVNDTFLPDVQPKPILPPERIILPPVSYGFFVIPDAQVKACKSAFENKITSEQFVNVYN